ncbi:MAG: FAD:protein FMN transferase [Coriobacteriia bacterium]|nr:FAD:protein FMN transferase [Coriobacteriia bacterium]MBS5478472.1 FAD:protein FMN transferase [Coriobacteriia bacterium]
MDVDFADIAHLIKPSAAQDGSHTLLLPVFNTQVSVKAFPGSQKLSGAQLDEALIAVRELCLEFELSLSRFRPNSEISRLNGAKGAWVELSPRTLDLVEKSRKYCEASGGVFDVTMGSATSLWDFHEGVIPSREALDAALRHVDYRMVEVDRAAGRARLTDPDAIIDLGGIAKGYIADEMAALLREHGCDCAFVNLGGNVLTIGTRPDGAPWRIGVRDPKNPATLRAVLPVVGKSVVTSGLYERNFTKDGVFYHHILSPKDGMPVKTDVGGSTIVSDLSLDGDGYSTTLFALGVQGSLEFVESRPELECIIIDVDDNVFVSSGLKGEVKLVESR